MGEGLLHNMSLRPAAGAVRPAKKAILRAQMAALARRIYGPDQPGNYHRDLVVNLLQTRRRAAGR